MGKRDMPKTKRSRIRRAVRWVVGLAGGGLAILAVAVWIAGLLAPNYTRVLTPAGHPVNISTYLELGSGDMVWVSTWLPEDLAPDAQISTLVETSRYGGQLQAGWLYRAMQTVLDQPDPCKASMQSVLDHGYAAVWVQSPGSCQSTGVRPIEHPPNELEAIQAAVDWIVAQPWSDGRVGAHGISYSATTADLMCASGSAAVRAVLAKAPDFDPYTQVIRPGGVGSDGFLRTRLELVQAMDRDDICGVVAAIQRSELSFFDRLMLRAYITGLQQPPGADRLIFKRALIEHRDSQSVDEILDTLTFKRPERAYGGLPSLDDVALYNQAPAIEQSTGAMLTRAGWWDAGVVEGALQKFLTIQRPMRIVIEPCGHVFEEVADPYRGTRPKTAEELADDELRFFEFFDDHMQNDAIQTERIVRYYTFGSDQWHETDVWPPPGFDPEPWFFGDQGALTREPQEDHEGMDAYTVDFSVTTGTESRWFTQLGQSVRYEDRSVEDRNLLTYTSDPLEHALELTGSPTVTLFVDSSHSDGAFHVYLEDVAPDGKVHYLTEGLLRGIHHRTQDPSTAPFVPLGVYRTYAEADAEPMTPGEIERLDITLFPISTVFKPGHRIRIALAGHDAALGTRYPESGTPRWIVHRSPQHGSRIVLPVRPAELP